VLASPRAVPRIDLRTRIRDVPNFPKPGIVFKDIMPLLADANALHQAVDDLADWARRASRASCRS
jgi:adenine phosphoribosyltransferase